MELLIDSEMKMFKGIKTPVIFLQNVITDLLLGLRAEEIFVAYHQYIRKKYDAEAGFITMNMPKLLDVLEKAAFKILLFVLQSIKRVSACRVEKTFMKRPCRQEK